MYRPSIILSVLLLHLQSHIAPVQCDSIIGYTVTDGTTETFSCPSTASFRWDYTFSGDTDTYAHCDWFPDEVGSSFEYRVGTYCDGTTALYTHWTESGSGYSSSKICTGDCVAVKLYDNPDDLEGLQWLVSCDDSIGVSTGISTLFLENPTDCELLQDTGTFEQGTDGVEIVGDTTTESTTTTSESLTSEPSTSVTDSASSTEIESSSSAEFPSRTSEPEEIESPTDGGTKDGGGPSGGVIAGAVVGSIVGVALIVGAIILAFRMGRRSRGDTEGPNSGLRDSLRSIPMPTMASHQPEPKPTVPVIQPVFVQDSQPYQNKSEG
ncbi:hypothetical protein FMUND_384 [Fusarium mundagurra]|uniref:Uncharacterized protein n=1 Tax=Fusarium mundagurra TaxID=1567541 RepID=A0A8H6DPC6_9HYPO|nr:hypothetical protein FMUND_384 [Fusarium mundagurra]